MGNGRTRRDESVDQEKRFAWRQPLGVRAPGRPNASADARTGSDESGQPGEEEKRTARRAHARRAVEHVELTVLPYRSTWVDLRTVSTPPVSEEPSGDSGTGGVNSFRRSVRAAAQLPRTLDAVSEPVASEPTCPGCGESERLLGRREDDSSASPVRRAGTGGCAIPRHAVRPVGRATSIPPRSPTSKRSRGTQLSITGTTIRHLCWTCDAELIDRQRRSGTALMPSDLPTLPGDHRR